MTEVHKKDFLAYLKGKKIVLIYTLLIFLIPAIALSLIKPLEYSSKVSVLIIQKINPNLDAYTAARAAEKLSDNLVQIIYTTSFYEKIRSTNFNLGLDWPETEKERRDYWSEKVSAKSIPDTSILEITAYDQNPEQAARLADAVAYVLITNGQEYHGGGEDIVIKKVDSNITSNYPVRPNIILNVISGLFFGIFVGLFIVYWKYSREYFNH